MKIDLTNEEISFIQQVLGEMPSKSGAFLVMNTIAKQVQEQQKESSGTIPKIELES
jgi:hypothetical protein